MTHRYVVLSSYPLKRYHVLTTFLFLFSGVAFSNVVVAISALFAIIALYTN